MRTHVGCYVYWNSFVDWSKQSSVVIKSSFTTNTKVVRGKDWTFGFQDGGQGAQGNVTGTLSSAGRISVKWSNGLSNTYPMGAGSKYALNLYAGKNRTLSIYLYSNGHQQAIVKSNLVSLDKDDGIDVECLYDVE